MLQIPVNEKKGLTFARGLRSILRHDPDKIMVGEIRDPETAQIAVQSALTGHLVFTTVHANNVFDVIGRFMHMDVDVYGFVSALNASSRSAWCAWSARNCAARRARRTPSCSRCPGSTLERHRAVPFLRGRGLRACRGTGYRGPQRDRRVPVLNDELRELIIAARRSAS